MNSEEGMSLAKMAVTVLLVVLVIGAIVGVVYLAYSWFNSGTAKLGDQVNSINSSAYAQFDDAQCTGTDVLTALKTYRDADMAIVICNKQNGAYDATATSATGFNYCAIIGEGTDTPTANDPNGYKITIDKAADGHFTVKSLKWNPASGLTFRNTNFAPTTSKSLADTFVKQNAQWYSNLIYDESTGEACGIMFREMQ